MNNTEKFRKKLEAKGAKMIWNVDCGSPFSHSIHSYLFLTEEEAVAKYNELPEDPSDYESWRLHSQHFLYLPLS